MSNSVVITSAVRTAIGSLGRSLKNVSGDELGSTVISEAIRTSNIQKDEVDEIIMGQVLTGGTGKIPLDKLRLNQEFQKKLLLILLIKFVAQE